MRAYTKTQRYVKGSTVYRDGLSISSFSTVEAANDLAATLNKQFGDVQAYELLNSIRDEITLYEDGDFSAKAILESVKAMLDSREK